ncbi:MAG TPA: hypothetical protein VNW97_19970 [Candidatus Saccharimonadales bacterium]|jgi:hypothetical protein|nr:hypothetical protein [Candidatus Saccharimonadales bacterium]
MSDLSPGPQKKPVVLPDAPLETLVHDSSAEVLIAVAADHRLTEDLALALLNRRDLPREGLEELNKNTSVAKLRKVRLAIVMHPHAPRHISVPTIRHLYTFELMQVALLPAVAADIKRAAEESLIGRLGTVSSGERMALAKQSSGRVAAALLHDPEPRIMQAALINPRMTETLIVKALRSPQPTELLAPTISRHEKWSQRHDVKMALLGNQNTPLAKVLQIAESLSPRALKEVLANSRLSANVKSYLVALIAKRANR